MKMFSFFIKFILVLIIILFMSSILYSNYEKGKGISSDKEILQVTDKTFYDSSGIISILCENFETAENWEKKHYYTGKGIKAILSSEKLSYADYRISISREGEYNLFILGNKRPYSESSDNVISFQVSKDGTEFEEQEQIMFNDLNVPSWSSISLINKGSNGRLIFKEPGVYILRLVPVKGYNFFLEKILLSNNSYLPYGIGPEQTITGVNFKEGFDEMIIIPPAWAFGVLYGGYTDQKETLEIVDRLIREDYPVDAYWIDSWFWNFKNKGSGPDGYISFIEDKTAFPDLEEMWSYFQKRNVKSGIWIWDCILRNGNEDVYENFKKRGFFSKTYIEKGKWHNKIGNTECGNIDFQNSEAVIYWKQMIKPFFDRGLDFLKLDRTSEIPYCKAAFEATGELGKETGGRGFILAHLHTTYDSRYKLYPAKWTGDAKICWSQPNYPDLSVYAMGGLKENIGMVSDCKRSTYDIPFLTHDCGGYNYFGSKDFSDELYAR
ncbi:MAG: TIM-barrel domain-containing protein, partial [Candidatus Eremiobacterota bacterium]